MGVVARESRRRSVFMASVKKSATRLSPLRLYRSRGKLQSRQGFCRNLEGYVMIKNTSTWRTARLSRAIAVSAVSGALVFGFGGTASASVDSESYPIGVGGDGGDADPVPPTTLAPSVVDLPATGSDSAGVWLKAGGGAVLAGGLLVAATSRRRNEAESTVAS